MSVGSISSGGRVTSSSRGRPETTFVAVAGVLLTVSACGGGETTGGPLPTLTSSISSSGSVDREAAEDAVVAKAYQDYVAAVTVLGASGNPDPATVRPWATERAARQDAVNMAIVFDNGERLVGDVIVDVRSVEVTGDTAVLLACVDGSKSVTVPVGKKPTGQEVGTAKGVAKVGMVREEGTWRMDTTEAAGAC